MNETDKAGQNYWSKTWESTEVPSAVNPRGLGLNNYANRCLHRIFRQVLVASPVFRDGDLLEIGCGASAWLPYFSKEYGYRISGIDYSQAGCVSAEQVLKNSKVEGSIYCLDAFSLPSDLLGKFDVVFSSGVVEHYRGKGGGG